MRALTDAGVKTFEVTAVLELQEVIADFAALDKKLDERKSSKEPIVKIDLKKSWKASHMAELHELFRPCAETVSSIFINK